MRQTLHKLLPVEEGEGVTFGLLSLALFLAIGGYFVIARTISRSLFLSNLPPEYIPIRYIVVTVGVVTASLLYTRYSTRIRQDHLIIGSTALMTAGVLLFRVLLATPLGGSLLVLGGLYVFLEISGTLTIIQFWTFAADLLNSRQAKRLFGPISSTGSLGGIIAGALVTASTGTLGTANLLLVLAATQLGFLACAWAIGRRSSDLLTRSPKRAARQTPTRPSLRQGFREIRTIPLLLSIAAIGVVTSLVSNIVEYQFDLTLQSSFMGNESGMTTFLGSFYFWAGAIGFTFQLLLSGWLLRTHGLSVSLLVFPLSFALGSMFVLATGAALWAVTVTRASEPVFRYNLNDTALSLLDLPLGRDVRVRTKAVIGGVLKPLTAGLLGILFLIVGNLRGVSPAPWSFIVLALVALWAYLIWRVRRQYQETLSHSILRRRFDPASETIDIDDETTKRILLDALGAADETQVLQALSLIREAPQIDWSAALIPLLEHPLLPVRIETLKVFGNPLYAPHLPALMSHIERTAGGERAASITAIGAIRGAEAAADISPYLADKDPVVRGAAVAAIILSGGLDGILQAALVLKNMLDDRAPAMRASGANALGTLGVKSFFQPLSILLEDEDAEVRNRALRAAGKLAHPDLLPGVIALLGQSVTKAAATQALLAYGAEAPNALGHYLDKDDGDLEIRRQIPKVLGRIRTPESSAVLVRRIDECDNHTRARIYKALVRLQARGVTVSVDDGALLTKLDDEMRIAYSTMVTCIDLETYINGSLLADALSIQQGFALDRIFFLLGLLYADANMAEIQYSIGSDDPRRKANATELLDTIISRAIKAKLLPLIEGPDDELLEVANHTFGIVRQPPLEHVRRLAASGDRWLGACTIFLFSKTRWPEIEDLIDEFMHSGDDLLGETAASAACQFFPQDKAMVMMRQLAADPALHATSGYAQRALAANSSSLGQGAARMPLSTVERVLFLRGVDLFRDISGEELVLIAQVCQERYFSDGEVFIRQGDLGDCLYIVVDGSVSVEVEGAGQVAAVAAREVVGEMAIMSRSPRTATCRALTDLTTLRIDHDDFWDLLAEKPGVALGVIRVLSSRLADRLQDLAALKAGNQPALEAPAGGDRAPDHDKPSA